MPDTAIAKKRRHRAGPPLGREFRRFAAEGLEVRSATDSDAITITGTPIVYNTPYSVRDMFGTFEETMLPGVADDVLSRNADVRFLFNHAGLPLARTLSGTLTLDATNTRGLPMVATLDARQQLANDLAVAIERGDVNQMSCGFSVGADEWNDAGDERSISKFSDLFDVSAVTYPASPTTSIELAYRSIIGQPIESQARVRQLWVAVGKDFRSGGGLSAEHAEHLQTALDALHSTEELDIASIVRSQTLEAEPSPVVERVGVPGTPDERREAAASFGDIQSALYTALQTEFGGDDGDEWCDLWIEDSGTDWVVWNSYGDSKPGPGMWKLAYTIDTDMAVTFSGDPAEVAIETSYVAVARSADPGPDPSLVALELEAEQLRLRGQRHRAA